MSNQNNNFKTVKDNQSDSRHSTSNERFRNQLDTNIDSIVRRKKIYLGFAILFSILSIILPIFSLGLITIFDPSYYNSLIKQIPYIISNGASISISYAFFRKCWADEILIVRLRSEFAYMIYMIEKEHPNIDSILINYFTNFGDSLKDFIGFPQKIKINNKDPD